MDQEVVGTFVEDDASGRLEVLEVVAVLGRHHAFERRAVDDCRATFTGTPGDLNLHRRFDAWEDLEVAALPQVALDEHG